MIPDNFYKCPAYPACKHPILVCHFRNHETGKKFLFVGHGSTIMLGPERRVSRGIRKRRRREQAHVAQFRLNVGLPPS